LKYRNRRISESQSIDPDFADALYGGESHRRSADPRLQRKTRQFCRQVQRALNLALADGSIGESLNGLFVEDVSPAPDCGRLLVHVFVPAGLSVADALSALRRDSARLRADVAMAITRKRAPELSFIPACQEAGPDE